MALATASSIAVASCAVADRPAEEPFYAPTNPPPIQELRWSNGELPKTLDPAKATTPPEMDAARALYEGLTEVDPKTLEAIPAVAEKWEVSEDRLTVTFTLREDVKWSNGDRVTASDFVRSWRRVAESGGAFPHMRLMSAIAGTAEAPTASSQTDIEEPADIFAEEAKGTLSQTRQEPSFPNQLPDASTQVQVFGASAPDESTLVVQLKHPVEDFASLVSHPVFRPVHAAESEDGATAKFTNGPFVLGQVSEKDVTLERSPTYRARQAVSLERIRFVSYETAEQALEAYRKGEVDAVTNAGLEPLALKLLSPYEDFESATHAALNFYEFNLNKAPFSDLRVREALALAIERDRIIDGELQGAGKPAFYYLPFEADGGLPAFAENRDKAKELLAEAGFKDGEGFPKIRLVINRNDMQQRVARAVAKMWKQTLGVDTEIVVKESAKISEVREAGDFDLLRRGAVIQTASRLIALETMLEWDAPSAQNGAADSAAVGNMSAQVPPSTVRAMDGRWLSEKELIEERVAIPLYFPVSYSLVKPYISGFSLSMFDAVSLQSVKVDTGWKPPQAGS